jgi:metal-dependent amidase/aminoacylase/carboxypeptidase family protein
LLSKGHNGNIRKRTIIKGVSAHAGAHPYNGVNALNAASLVLLALNSLRETFKEEDLVRLHSIITKGGDAVNAVPDEVVIESYVRAANSKALKAANQKVNRAISAAAAANGCVARIEDVPGAEALNEDVNLAKLALTVFEDIAGKDGYEYQDKWYASSTDMGDISSLVPTIHAYATGAIGESHGINYYVKDAYNACVNAAKFEIGLIRKLLSDDAKEAKDIISKFTPTFKSIDEYLANKEEINMQKDTVIFNEDGTITLNYKG